MSPQKFYLLLALLLGGVLFTWISSSGESEEKKLTIGILQTASHPALDQTRDSFIGEIKELLQGDVDFVVQNAEGSQSAAQSIAESFHARRKIDAIFAIGTPAVQAAARIEQEKPIFIAAVSEPESLGLGKNICGASDRIHTEAQADFIRQLLPNVQKIAILYNPGESNSSAMVQKMEQSVRHKGIECHLLGVHAESEIVQAVMSASRKADALLVPADNLLVAAMPLLAKEAAKRGRPLIASDIPSVEKGALAAQGADYRDLGRQTARLAYRVLALGETPEIIGIEDPENVKIALNEPLLSHLKIVLPESIHKEAL